MKRLALVAIFIVLQGCVEVRATSPNAAMASSPSAADRAKVERVVYDWESAWNRHNMEDFANLFHPDAEWVHWRGGLWSGKAAIYEGHKAIHETYYRNTNSTVRGIEALHFLSPTVAYLRVRSDMVGDERSPGQTNRYRRTMILSQRDGKWLVIKGHNTRIADGLQ